MASSSRPRRAGPAREAVAPPPAGGLDARIALSGLPGASRIGRHGGRLGIVTVRDLLFHLPREHRDLRRTHTVDELRALPERTLASARLTVLRVATPFSRRGGTPRTVAVVADESGELELTWFGARRYLDRRLPPGSSFVFSGRVRRRGWQVTLENAEFVPADEAGSLHAGRLVPVYRLTEGIDARLLRVAIRAALDAHGASYPEYLGEALRGDLVPIAQIGRAHV